MHTTIYAIVDAQTSDDACAAADAAFDRLTGSTPGRARVFDYCLTLDEVDADHPIRAADHPVAARLDRASGERLLDLAWTQTIEQTHAAVETLQAELADRDPQAVRRDEDALRRALARVGRPEGPTTALYDHNGLGLVRRERVAAVVDACDEPWIVPADAHYHP